MKEDNEEKNIEHKELYNCTSCGKEIEKGTKKCPHCGKKVKKFIPFCITMLLLFLVVTIITDVLSSVVLSSVNNYKYGFEFLYESLVVLAIMIVMLLSKNSYVFTQKKMNLGKAILCGWPILIISAIYLFQSITATESFEFFNLINLILYCLTIGLYEEFLCRGWLQNEFIERFGKNKKQVIRSIIVASLVFGAMHLTNVLAGQSLFETILQVIFAASVGVFLGSVYYKTKNIWAVVLLHGFYDFTIFLGEHSLIRDCTTGTVTNTILLDNVINLSFTCAFYIIAAIWVFRNCKFSDSIGYEENDDNKEEKINNKKLSKGTIGLIVATVVVLIGMFLPFSFTSEKEWEKYNICFSYENKTIGEHKITSYFTYEFDMTHSKDIVTKLETPIEIVNPDGTISYQEETTTKEEYKFRIYLDDKNYDTILENTITKEKVVLSDTIENINGVVVIDNKNHFIIGVNTLDSIYSKIYYTKVMKDDLTNDKDFLNKIVDSFESYDLPLLATFGSIEIIGQEDKYLYMISDVQDEFYIDENGKLYNFVFKG